MNSIPAIVEASLTEAGFSTTEILILRRILEDDALTLREIAGRSGKSTGVLDQAMKKLLRKEIVTKTVINAVEKYTLVSMEAVMRWIEEDIRRKRELLMRRHENFESFMQSVAKDKKRPEIHHFNGIEGLAQAYRKLLDCGPEILGYIPVFCAIEDHPLRDFMVEWFRQRRKRGIFSRIIAHDTPFGRRFRTRDPFEYRQSILIDEKQYPFAFEKYICGDSVACINHAEKKASIIKYPELAAMERSLFEGLWTHAKTLDQESRRRAPAAPLKKSDVLKAIEDPLDTEAPPPVAAPVPLSVRALSGLREFFVSRKSIAAFGAIAILSAGLTFSLYNYTQKMQFQRMQDTVKSIAATGAFQFDAKDLDALQVEKDWKKPQWRKVVGMLEQIRKVNDDVEFVYILRRKNTNTQAIEFIADSHSMNPYAEIDLNNDGNIDDADALQWPGQEYRDAPIEAVRAFSESVPIVSDDIYQDQWGSLISGYAQISDVKGDAVGVLAVDMRAELLDVRTANIFPSVLYFIGFFLFFVLLRLAAFNRVLFVELWGALQMRKVLIILVLCAELAFAVTFGLYRYMLRLTIDDIGRRTMAIVATAASQFDPKDLEQLHWARDMKKPAYQRVFAKLNEVRDSNEDANIKYAYIMRPIDGERLFEFVADADSNFYLATVGPDLNNDGLLDEADENVAPGVQYFDEGEKREGLDKSTYEKNFYTDQWGTWISAYTPIRGQKEKYVLGADVDFSEVYEALHSKFTFWLWFIGGFSTILLINLLLGSVKTIRPRNSFI